ncbi:MAG: hypothetical protein M3Z37_06485 [Candidatus Eremiobacteraeota bacterium]|nr:hypothetical protein [Candidatus Eremiobacteraeota bacterium]
MLSRTCNNRRPGTLPLLASALITLVALAGCSHRQNNEGVQNLLGVSTPGLTAGPGNVGYVDLDVIVKAHPLHDQLAAMDRQIAVLRQQSVSVPSGMSAAQNAAYSDMQRELDAAQQRFQQDLAQRRAVYERREADAIGQLQASTLGAQKGNAGGVLGGLQQQYGDQAKQLQKQALSTLDSFRSALFKQDADHLRHVQQLLASDVQTKTKQRINQVSAAETKFQVDLARRNQSIRLNLQAKLQNLALADKDRSAYSAQLKALDQAEATSISALRAKDNADLSAYEKSLQSQAAAKFDAERKRTQAATQATLVKRQHDVQTAMGPQMQALGGKFQQQLADANKRLANDANYRSQAQGLHTKMQAAYVGEANQVAASYRDTRRALIGKYSAIAHMQFQDNQAIAAQMDKIAADRRDLLAKIVDQVRVQVQRIAAQNGVSIVFQSVRGAGSALNLTQAVTKAIAAQGTAPSTTPSAGG